MATLSLLTELAGLLAPLLQVSLLKKKLLLMMALLLLMAVYSSMETLNS